MSAPIHNLARPHVDALSGLPELSGSAGFEELERRVDELILEWLKFYFSGDAFLTPMPSGNLISKSFDPCHIMMGRSSPPDPVTRPIIHTILADRKDDGGRAESGGRTVITGTWVMNTFVRFPAQAPVSASSSEMSATAPAGLAAHQVNRRAASQVAWLLASPHARDLVMKGVGDPRILSGPRAIQSGSWDVYQIAWSVKIFQTLTAE